ncbi:hypothetical protein TruAng_011534 [Truncatella angustata]|nr:hypothetical protein TruAng_011534 [Truncatella angustata]
MKSTDSVVALALVLAPFALAKEKCKPYVSSDALQESINLDDLLAGSQKLQDIADASDGNRAFGSAGHNLTIDYIYDTLNALGYYDVYKQPFVELFYSAEASLVVDGVEYEPGSMTYSPGGTFSAPLVLVSNLGCDVTDFSPEVEGSVALISRGTCSFAAKATNAKSAGAVAAVVYNNQEGKVSGTLGAVSDDYAPVVGITQEQGITLIAALESGEVIADFGVDAVLQNRTTFNVIAQTKTGDKNNVLMLGAHTDSVAAGPGINDDGSGTIGILSVATALSKFTIKNAVRFGFWSAEEYGKLGSYYYIKQLNTSATAETELAKIRAYLNFDMIASPNFIYGIYDGDGNAFNSSGPNGSGDIEKTFEDYFKTKNTPSIAYAFTGRSDYAGFIENGIPSGGISSGSDGIKTAEQAALFGGEVGVSYDPNYHQAGDTIDNLAQDAYLTISKGIADAVAKYALSFATLPPVNIVQRRWAADRAKAVKRTVTSHAHSNLGPCAHNHDEL